MNRETPQDRTDTGGPDPARRAAFAQELLRALTASCPGSRAELRGSLARGTADEYSDIDIAWTVPDDRFDACLDAVPGVLGAVVPLDSLRTDPDSRNSRERRLLFAAFHGLPLFWRVDLEVVRRADPAGAWRRDPEGASAPVAGRPGPGRGDPAAHRDDWSRPASALANAVAATKAVLRGQPENARGLLERGFRRIDEPEAVSGCWRADIRRLAEAAAGREPELRPLADRVLGLAESHRARLMWWSFPADVRERVDGLVLLGRDIQAVGAMRESGIEPRPELHACVEVLDGRHRALADRIPPPVRPDVDAMAAAARDLPRDPVAVEAVWDGDTRGWIVVLTAVLAGPWESVDLDGFRIGAAGTGEAARTGRELAERLGVPFRFASPDEPDEDAPRWWDARH
ncbi:nucleotidyltransferase domain-containing protein [Streptomyces sp. CLV115]|uniref:nucleotidyltransferase domain-containing protein n=1 Tax=Streptomyces sp. CLV115 TaxID=3138502 RepID=UPI00313D1417